jgi:hypothetical protein
LAAVDIKRGGSYRTPDPLAERHGPGRIRLRQDEEELLTAPPTGDILIALHGLHPPGELLQNLVAALWPTLSVTRLK